VTQQLTKMKIMLAAVAMLAAMMSGAIPVAFAQEVAEEIAVTGVVSYQGTKADGTPIYGITEESTLGEERYQKEGYLMEGDYSAYVGERITVHGVLQSGHAERVLEVTWIE
jgi:opacity protein-like surface antigen